MDDTVSQAKLSHAKPCLEEVKLFSKLLQQHSGLIIIADTWYV